MRFLVILLLFLPFSAHAAEWSFDVSAGVTRSTATDPQFFKGTCCPPLTLEEEFTGTGERFAFGITYGDWLRFEAGWTRYGDGGGTVRDSLIGACVPRIPPVPCPPPPLTETFYYQLGEASWFAFTPVLMRSGSVELIGKIGKARTTMESFSDDSRPPWSVIKDTERLLGLGIGWHAPSGLGVRLDFDRHGSTASVVALSVVYRY